jgi:hypothetical protein
MIETAIYLFIGALIGWNFPQPQFAKNIQAKITALFTKSTQQ